MRASGGTARAGGRRSEDSRAPSGSRQCGRRERAAPRLLSAICTFTTQNSIDSYSFGVRATPDDAYRFAKGEALAHPLGYSIRLQGGPLDFLAVTDHGEYLGVAAALADPGHPQASHPVAVKLRSSDPKERWEAGRALDGWVRGKPVSGLDLLADRSLDVAGDGRGGRAP